MRPAAGAANDELSADQLFDLAEKAYFKQPEDSAGQSYVFSLYEKAARLGNAEAMFVLGWTLEEGGMGFVQSAGAARKWYAKAGDAGHLSASYNLALMCLEGKGGPKDIRRAKDILYNGAANQHCGSMYHLAMILEQTMGQVGPFSLRQRATANILQQDKEIEMCVLCAKRGHSNEPATHMCSACGYFLCDADARLHAGTGHIIRQLPRSLSEYTIRRLFEDSCKDHSTAVHKLVWLNDSFTREILKGVSTSMNDLHRFIFLPLILLVALGGEHEGMSQGFPDTCHEFKTVRNMWIRATRGVPTCILVLCELLVEVLVGKSLFDEVLLSVPHRAAVWDLLHRCCTPVGLASPPQEGNLEASFIYRGPATTSPGGAASSIAPPEYVRTSESPRMAPKSLSRAVRRAAVMPGSSPALSSWADLLKLDHCRAILELRFPRLYPSESHLPLPMREVRTVLRTTSDFRSQIGSGILQTLMRMREQLGVAIARLGHLSELFLAVDSVVMELAVQGSHSGRLRAADARIAPSLRLTSESPLRAREQHFSGMGKLSPTEDKRAVVIDCSDVSTKSSEPLSTPSEGRSGPLTSGTDDATKSSEPAPSQEHTERSEAAEGRAHVEPSSANVSIDQVVEAAGERSGFEPSREGSGALEGTYDEEDDVALALLQSFIGRADSRTPRSPKHERSTKRRVRQHPQETEMEQETRHQGDRAQFNRPPLHVTHARPVGRPPKGKVWNPRLGRYIQARGRRSIQTPGSPLIQSPGSPPRTPSPARPLRRRHSEPAAPSYEATRTCAPVTQDAPPSTAAKAPAPPSAAHPLRSPSPRRRGTPVNGNAPSRRKRDVQVPAVGVPRPRGRAPKNKVWDHYGARWVPDPQRRRMRARGNAERPRAKDMRGPPPTLARETRVVITDALASEDSLPDDDTLTSVDRSTPKRKRKGQPNTSMAARPKKPRPTGTLDDELPASTGSIAAVIDERAMYRKDDFVAVLPNPEDTSDLFWLCKVESPPDENEEMRVIWLDTSAHTRRKSQNFWKTSARPWKYSVQHEDVIYMQSVIGVVSLTPGHRVNEYLLDPRERKLLLERAEHFKSVGGGV